MQKLFVVKGAWCRKVSGVKGAWCKSCWLYKVSGVERFLVKRVPGAKVVSGVKGVWCKSCLL